MSAAELFRSFHPTLVRRLHRCGATAEEAEDAASEAWRILLEVGCPHDNAQAWLTVVARHALWTAKRRSEREAELLRPVVAIESDRLEAIEALHVLAQLKPRQRYVLARRAAGLSYLEIQAEANATRTWVNRHASEGRAALRNAAA